MFKRAFKQESDKFRDGWSVSISAIMSHDASPGCSKLVPTKGFGLQLPSMPCQHSHDRSCCPIWLCWPGLMNDVVQQIWTEVPPWTKDTSLEVHCWEVALPSAAQFQWSWLLHSHTQEELAFDAVPHLAWWFGLLRPLNHRGR